MVCIAAYFYYRTAESVADATKVGVQFSFYRWVYQRFAVFGAENEVYVVFYE